jgi:hypothetical protein
MELALQGLQWITCLIYLDDVIVFGRDFKEHMERVTQVLERIEAARLKLKPEKCQLLQEEVTFLGHVVSADGIRPNPDNVTKILEMPIPTKAKEVRQLLGMGSYYRRFIPNFAQMVRPMVELTRKNQEYRWTEDCQSSFDQLKQAFIGPEIMAYPAEEGEFILDTDASASALGRPISETEWGREGHRLRQPRNESS